MNKKKILLSELVVFLGDDIKSLFGTFDGRFVDHVTDIAHADETTLDWIKEGNPCGQQLAELSKSKVIIVSPEISYTERCRELEKVLIVVDDPKKTLIKIINHYFVEHFSPGIDATAYIHPEAQIGENVYIGPNCYIGKSVIGDNNVIHSNVSIYDRTVIGNNNVIHSGALICVDGLGCVREKNGILTEFPQMGGVIIGDNCYIGGNTHIASGSLSDTIIENGCKINGMCFIGSNDILHENVWITGSSMLAGSVEVGKNTNIFSRVVVRDWCKLGEGCTIGMGAVVTKNVPAGEVWVGNPAKRMEKKS